MRRFFISAFLGSFWLAFFNHAFIVCAARRQIRLKFFGLNAFCRYAKSAKYKKRRQKARRTTINLPQICKNRPYAADSSRSLPHLRLGYAVRRFTPPYRLFGVPRLSQPLLPCAVLLLHIAFLAFATALFSGRAVLARKARSIGRQSYLRPRASG